MKPIEPTEVSNEGVDRLLDKVFGEGWDRRREARRREEGQRALDAPLPMRNFDWEDG